MSREANVPFFVNLAAFIKNPPKMRDAENWIWRAWIPLRLWECKNVVAALTLVQETGRLLERPEVTFLNKNQFRKKWNNVRRDIGLNALRLALDTPGVGGRK
jgi:hypothetical protein